MLLVAIIMFITWLAAPVSLAHECVVQLPYSIRVHKLYSFTLAFAMKFILPPSHPSGGGGRKLFLLLGYSPCIFQRGGVVFGFNKAPSVPNSMSSLSVIILLVFLC